MKTIETQLVLQQNSQLILVYDFPESSAVNERMRELKKKVHRDWEDETTTLSGLVMVAADMILFFACDAAPLLLSVFFV